MTTITNAGGASVTLKTKTVTATEDGGVALTRAAIGRITRGMLKANERRSAYVQVHIRDLSTLFSVLELSAQTVRAEAEARALPALAQPRWSVRLFGWTFGLTRTP